MSKLHDAARLGDLQAMARLHVTGAPLDAPDHNGMTPLMTALHAAKTEAALWLLERGASVTAVDLGGRGALEWAHADEEVRARLVALGARPSIADALPSPFDETGFLPHVRAFFTLLRRGHFILAEDAETVAFLRDDMPPDLAALLHTWAHKPRSSWLHLGHWEVQRRSLHAAPAPFERGVVVGHGYWKELLVATWTPGESAMKLVSVDQMDHYDVPLGTLEEMLETQLLEAQAKLEEGQELEGALPELAALVEGPANALYEDESP